MLAFFPNSWYNYRVLVGFFRESLRGFQNLVAPAAGAKVARLVFDDSSPLLTLFGLLVPHRCRIPWGARGVSSWSSSGPILVAFWTPVWYQFGSSLVPFWVPVWSQLCPSLVPVWFQIGPSLVPDWFQLGLILVPFWSHFGAWFSSNLVPV